MFDLNGNVPLAFTVKDAAGALTNAVSTLVTVTKPDGTPTVVTMANPSTGTYTGTGPSTQSGRYTVVYASTTPTDSKVDTYDVRPASSTALLSLADARAAVNFAKTINDAELRDYIDSVTTIIEGEIGPVLPRTVTETVYGGGELYLSNRPVTAITSVTGYQSGAWTITPTNVIFDSVTGVVQLFNRVGFNDEYTVVYTAGRGLDPAILAAARQLLADLWDSQRPNRNPANSDPLSTEASTMGAYAKMRSSLRQYYTPAVG